MKRTLSLVLSLIMILGIFASMPVTVNAATSGTTGDCIWSLDGTVLTISGNGEMEDYLYSSSSPWGTGITEVIIEEGVTNISYGAFDGCFLKTITIPRTIKKIDASFDECSVGKIHITDLAAWCSIDFLFYHNPGWLDWVGNPLSRGATLYLNGEKLKTDLVIPEGTKEVSDGCFAGIHFDSISFPKSIEYIGYDSFSATTVYLPNYDVVQNLKLGTGGYFLDMTSSCFNNPLFRADYVYINNEDCTETVQQHCYNGDWYWESDGAFASCDRDQTWYTNCTRCGYEQTKIVPATSHVLHTYILDIPTCTVEGYKSIECENCPYCVYEDIPATGHTEAPLAAIDPTCTKPGLSEGTHCSVCGEVFVAQTETAPPTGHTEGDWIIDTDSTCTAKGTKHTECTVCGVTISTGEIYEKPHQTQWLEIEAPTCSESGKRVKKCTACNNEIEVETVPATGHSFVNGVCNSCGETFDFKYTIANNSVIITGYNGTDTDIVIPSEIDGLPVTSISRDVFYNNDNITSVTISNGVESIGYEAFYDCDNLVSVTIPDSVTNMDNRAFATCDSLTTVTIGTGLVKMGDYDDAFRGCYSLTAINVDESNPVYTSVDGVLFNKGMTELILYPSGKEFTEYTIPDGVTMIGSDAFQSCNNLTSVTISDSVTTIGPQNFFNCNKITSVIIPDSVSIINAYTFYNCENLTSITLSNNITFIGEAAFSHCNNLAAVICTDCSFDINSKEFGMDAFDIFAAEWTYADHTPSDWFEFSKATCTNNGANHIECTECKKVLESETIPATGHTSSDWIIDSQATINAPGKKHKECTTCGEVLETVTITQLKPSTPKVTTTNEIGGVNVTWNKVAGAVKYNVYRRQGGYSTWTLVGTTTGNTLLDKNVKSGIYYVYSVRAYNVSGGYSDFVSANTNTRKYMAVPQLTGISNATNGLYIKWNPVSGVTNGYRVYRRGAGSVHWYYLGTVKTNYFTDTTIKNNSGEYYRYTVIADGGYHSKFDTTGLYLKRLANPILTSAVSSKSGITVKWGSVKTATDYYVYRKTANSGWVRIATLPGNSTTTYLDKTAKKGTTYTYTVRACSGSTISYFNSGISCYDKY